MHLPPPSIVFINVLAIASKFVLGAEDFEGSDFVFESTLTALLKGIEQGL